jgi:hypothetical protein
MIVDVVTVDKMTRQSDFKQNTHGKNNYKCSYSWKNANSQNDCRRNEMLLQCCNHTDKKVNWSIGHFTHRIYSLKP